MLLIRSFNPFLCLTVILITFNLKSQSESDCAAEKEKPKYVYFFDYSYKSRTFFLISKKRYCLLSYIPEMEKRAVHIFA